MQQGSERWLEARRYRITGSRLAAILGHHPYQSANQQLKEYLSPNAKQFSTFARTAMDWGTNEEPKARDAYIKWLSCKLGGAKVEVRVPGLSVCPEAPWIAASFDGLVYVRGHLVALLEIKAPFAAGKKQPYNLLPLYYYDQIQLGLFLSGAPMAHFFVWSPGNCAHPFTVDTIMPNPTYWHSLMMPGAHHMFFTRLLPNVVDNERPARHE